jgi:hypothetical protein
MFCHVGLVRTVNTRYAKLPTSKQLRDTRTQLAIMARQICETDHIPKQFDHQSELQRRSQQSRRSSAAPAAAAGSSYWRVAIWLLLLCLLPGSDGVHVQVSKSMKDHLKQVTAPYILLLAPHWHWLNSSHLDAAALPFSQMASDSKR